MKRQRLPFVEALSELTQDLNIAQDAAGSNASHTSCPWSTGPRRLDRLLESEHGIRGLDLDDGRVFVERRTLDGDKDVVRF